MYSASIKIVDYLDGFQTEARGSQTPRKRRSHKTNNGEQNHYYSFGLKHEVYIGGSKRDFGLPSIGGGIQIYLAIFL